MSFPGNAVLVAATNTGPETANATSSASPSPRRLRNAHQSPSTARAIPAKTKPCARLTKSRLRFLAADPLLPETVSEVEPYPARETSAHQRPRLVGSSQFIGGPADAAIGR